MSNVYITSSGDMWDAIAYKVFGNEYLFLELVMANPKYMDTYIFSAGIELVIPAVDLDIYTDRPDYLDGEE